MNQRTNFFNKLASAFNGIETILVVAAAISFFLTCREITAALYGVYASLGLLALLYFLMSLRRFEGKVAGIRIAIRKVVFFAYVLSTITLLSSFTFDDTLQTGKMILPCLIFLGVSIILLCLWRFKLKETAGFFAHIIRCLVFALILGWLYLCFN